MKHHIIKEDELGFLAYNNSFDIRSQDDEHENYFRFVSTTRTLIVQAKTYQIKQEWLSLLSYVKTELNLKNKSSSSSNNKHRLSFHRVKSSSEFEGYLQLMGEHIKKWKKYYFVLFSDDIKYYEKPLDKKACGIIKLNKQEAAIASLDALDGAFVIIPFIGSKNIC